MTVLREGKESGNEYYLFNPNMNGFYRVLYDSVAMEMIQSNFAQLSTLDQYSILSDRYALMESNYIDTYDYLQFLNDITSQMSQS